MFVLVTVSRPLLADARFSIPCRSFFILYQSEDLGQLCLHPPASGSLAKSDARLGVYHILTLADRGMASFILCFILYIPLEALFTDFPFDHLYSFRSFAIE